MRKKKLFKRTLLILSLILLGFAVWYAWFSFPIISGFSAKNACSCAFIQNRTAESINAEELGSFPLTLGSIHINYQDSSVTGTVWGLSKRKAIFRKGLGCTLVNDYPETTVRAQPFSIPTATINYDSIDWLVSNPVQVDTEATHQNTLNRAVAVAFDTMYQKKPILTKAVLVVYKGKIIAEQYAQGYDKNSMFLGWSMAKSITGALIGILVKSGKLTVSNPAPVAQWASENDERHRITIQHLLQQTSGLKFEENYASHSNATHMLFDVGNMAAFVAGLPLKEVPGTQFYYSSGNSNLLSGIIRKTVGEKDYHSFPYTALFYKLGMYHTLLEPDASGTFVGSSYIYASARDYARFGLLYLNNGVWNGEQILPEGWVQKSVQAPANSSLKNYGYQFWLNGMDDESPANKAYPEMPDDLFMADGYGGQRIFIIPSKSLVIVRLGVNKFDEHRFLREVKNAIP